MNIWGNQQFICLAVFSILIPLALILRAKISHGLLFATTIVYFLFCGVSVFMNPTARYEPKQLQLMIDISSAKAFIIILLLGLFLAYMREKAVQAWLRLIEIAFVINALFVLCFGYGMFNARSSDTATMACIIPSILLRNKLKLWVRLAMSAPIIAAIVVTHGSTSYFILGVMALAYVVITKSWKTLAVLPLVGVAAIIREGDKLLDSSNRVELWKVFTEWYWNNCSRMNGCGLGTFEALGVFIQANLPNPERIKTTGVFLFMHNEYLQVLFETGIIGLVVALNLFLTSIWFSRNKPWVFVSLAGVSVLFLTQFPLRFFVSAFFVGLIVRSSFYET